MVAVRGKKEAVSLRHVRRLTSQMLQNNDFCPEDLVGLVPMNDFLGKDPKGGSSGDPGPQAKSTESRRDVQTHAEYHDHLQSPEHVREVGVIRNSSEKEQIQLNSDAVDTSIHEHRQSDFLQFPKDPTASLRCELCNLVCCGPVDLEAHLVGKRHRRALRRHETSAKLDQGSASEHAARIADGFLPAVSVGNLDQARCELCDVSYSSFTVVESHLRGKRHRKMVASAEASDGTCQRPADSSGGKHSFRSCSPIHAAPVVPAAAAERQKTCAVCNIPCNSAICLAQHLEGKRHRKAVAQMEAQFRIDSLFTSGGTPLGNANASVSKNRTAETLAVGRTETQLKMPPKNEAVENLGPLNNLGVAGVSRETSICLPPRSTSPLSQELACHVCNFFASSSTHLSSHLAGRRHLKSVKELELLNELDQMIPRSNVAESDYSRSTNGSLECETCALSCSSFTVLMAHLKGRRHRRTIARQEALKKIASLKRS